MSIDAGAGYRLDGLYARGAVGVTMAESGVGHAGYTVLAGAGFVPLDWLHAGLLFNWRSAADSFTRTWLERSWSFGVEARQCRDVAGAWQLCLTQAFYPIGRRTTRGQVVAEQAFQVPEVKSHVIRVDLGFSLARRL